MGPGALRFLVPGPMDVVDLILVSALVYQALKLFRGTRAPYILSGFLIVIAVAVLAELMNLVALNLIISIARTVGLVALVILFQPEIRRALSIIGNAPLVNTLLRRDTVEVDKLVDAVFDLKTRGLGAIVVLEGRMGISEVTERGVTLDAELSSALLGTIFTPPSPLHDGAVILKGGKVVAARAVLPLSSKQLGKRGLGTRHMAAVGITEVSDCVSIVVSEQRKTVRAARGGDLTDPLTAGELRSFLTQTLGTP